MRFVEEALRFTVADADLLAILARPDDPGDCGVLIVVGGPQYRVGSHRQFLLLSRRLAAHGYPVWRFDYRGMGDSGGAPCRFDEISDDIGAAVDAFQRACPSVGRVVLWGLCDGASAALLYVQSTRDPRIAGLLLLNPWVRSETSLAQTHIRHYYAQRLLQREFWIKLMNGRMQVRKSLAGLLKTAQRARSKPVQTASEPSSFPDRMAEGWRGFKGAVLLILSGQDYTAREFVDHIGSNAKWSGLLAAGSTRRVDFPDADHTFSGKSQRQAIESETLKWLGSL
jgi:exosortase A-associated hydrolase 1